MPFVFMCVRTHGNDLILNMISVSSVLFLKRDFKGRQLRSFNLTHGLSKNTLGNSNFINTRDRGSTMRKILHIKY